MAFIWATVLIGLIGCESEAPTSEPITIGHRGLPTLFPENTKESFDGLLNGGIYSVETDILMAAGDTVMIFHDPEVSRLTNLTGATITMTPETLKKGIKEKSGGTGLTLAEFFTLYETRFELIFLDLKGGQDDAIRNLIDQVITMIQTKKLYAKVVITSPNADNLEYIQSIDPDIKLAIDENELGVKTAISHHFGYCLLSIDNMSKSLYSFSNSANVKLIAYTTQNIIEVEKAITLGCDGIMTDVPLEMRKLSSK